MLECPSEKKKPTASGRWPSVISLRVVLSIAAMWSASKAWRRPSVYAVMPSPTPNTPLAPSAYCWGATTAINRKKPTACSPTMTTASPAARLHSAGVSAPRVRRSTCATWVIARRPYAYRNPLAIADSLTL